VSVTTTANIKWVPLIRDETIKAKSPELIARWHTMCWTTGDGSGGYILQSFSWNNTVGVFGPHTLWTIDEVAFSCAVALTYALLRVYVHEMSSGGYWLEIHKAFDCLGSGYPAAQKNSVPFLMRFTEDATLPSQMQLQFAPNTNGATYVSMLGGRVLDERYI
jgi:hypothetical protein